MPGFDVGEFLRKNLGHLLGQQITLVQAASVHGAKPVPLPPPTGEPREVRFSTQTTSVEGIGQTPGTVLPRIVFEGRDGVVTPRKNERVTAVLGTVTLEIDPKGSGAMSLEWQKISNIPTVGGAQPGTWDYTYELHGGGGAYTLTIQQNSTALRRGHRSEPSVLGANEELLLAAPVGGLMLHATPQEPRVTGELVASFLIRDFPELMA
jgi:hypothetical protein